MNLEFYLIGADGPGTGSEGGDGGQGKGGFGNNSGAARGGDAGDGTRGGPSRGGRGGRHGGGGGGYGGGFSFTGIGRDGFGSAPGPSPATSRDGSNGNVGNNSGAARGGDAGDGTRGGFSSGGYAGRGEGIIGDQSGTFRGPDAGETRGDVASNNVSPGIGDSTPGPSPATERTGTSPRGTPRSTNQRNRPLPRYSAPRQTPEQRALAERARYAKQQQEEARARYANNLPAIQSEIDRGRYSREQAQRHLDTGVISRAFFDSIIDSLVPAVQAQTPPTLSQTINARATTSRASQLQGLLDEGKITQDQFDAYSQLESVTGTVVTGFDNGVPTIEVSGFEEGTQPGQSPATERTGSNPQPDQTDDARAERSRGIRPGPSPATERTGTNPGQRERDSGFAQIADTFTHDEIDSLVEQGVISSKQAESTIRDRNNREIRDTGSPATERTGTSSFEDGSRVEALPPRSGDDGTPQGGGESITGDFETLAEYFADQNEREREAAINAGENPDRTGREVVQYRNRNREFAEEEGLNSLFEPDGGGTPDGRPSDRERYASNLPAINSEIARGRYSQEQADRHLATGVISPEFHAEIYSSLPRRRGAGDGPADGTGTQPGGGDQTRGPGTGGPVPGIDPGGSTGGDTGGETGQPEGGTTFGGGGTQPEVGPYGGGPGGTGNDLDGDGIADDYTYTEPPNPYVTPRQPTPPVQPQIVPPIVSPVVPPVRPPLVPPVQPPIYRPEGTTPVPPVRPEVIAEQTENVPRPDGGGDPGGDPAFIPEEETTVSVPDSRETERPGPYVVDPRSPFTDPTGPISFTNPIGVGTLEGAGFGRPNPLFPGLPDLGPDFSNLFQGENAAGADPLNRRRGRNRAVSLASLFSV